MKKNTTQKKEIVINPDNLIWYFIETMLIIIMKKMGLVFFPFFIMSMLISSSFIEIVQKQDPIQLKKIIFMSTMAGLFYSILQG